MNRSGGEVDVGTVGFGLFIFYLLLMILATYLIRAVVRRFKGHEHLPKSNTSSGKSENIATSPIPESATVPVHKMVNYSYAKREYMMTSNEREFYKLLFRAVGRKYLIFPQIHLDRILDSYQTYQYHDAAYKSIRNFSVDYVLCDTEFRIICAIELDDRTHDQHVRKIRDEAVNSIFDKARLPLIRVPLNARINSEELTALIARAV